MMPRRFADDTPYWHLETPPMDAPDCTWSGHADIVIIGGGYTGLSAALTLVHAGRSVVILEKERLGEGASTRNAGITSGNLRLSIRSLTRRFGPEKALQLYAEGMEARLDLYRFIEQEKIDCDFALVGRLVGLRREGALAQARRDGEQLRKVGIETEFYEQDRLSEMINSSKYKAGVFRPDIGAIHPGKLLHGMVRLAIRDGVRVFSQTPALSMARDGQVHVITTPKGQIRADHVIGATNGFTDGVLPWLRQRLAPVVTEMIATEEIGENMVQSLMPRKTMFGEALKIGYYYRPSPDGKRILLGGVQPSRDRQIARQNLHNGLASIFPLLHDTAITHHWRCFAAFPFDQMPTIAVHDGVIYPTGFCGSGTVWSRWLGQKAAHIILRGQTASAFANRPMRTLPFYSGDPWFLPLVTSYYRLMDRFTVTFK